MPEVVPDQIWETNTETGWRRAQVVDVLGDQVTLKYLDMPEAPDLARSFTIDRVRMLNEPHRYRLVTLTS
jgi:hypothetical protein